MEFGIWLNILLFALGFLLLIKGGDWFVDGAVDIAHRFHMSELLIGATVVSIGTTLPELMVSSQGAMAGSSSIAFGNAVGSVICNTALISALTLVVSPAVVKRRTFALPAIAFFIAAAFFCINAYCFGKFSRPVGIIFLIMFAAYMVTSVYSMLKNPAEPVDVDGDGVPDEPVVESSLKKNILMMVLGAAAIAIGARLLVDNTTVLAKAIGVPDSVIALTLVALGTSLPELVTAITSLIKGHGALSLGNIIGANLFNLVLVLGASVTIRPFELTTASASSLMLDIPLMLGVMLLLTVPPFVSKKLYRWQGVVLLIGYIGYVGYQYFAMAL